MSEGFVPAAGRFSFHGMSGASGFRSDARFAGSGERPRPEPSHSPPEPERQDPIALAFAEGYATGAADAQAQAAEHAALEAAAGEGLALSFARLDHALAQELRQRLRDTVAALCEAALAPFALDETALMARIERAVALLARADDERVIRLHPDDIDLLSVRFAADWQVIPDAALERGAIRVETQNGGVEDSPELWRRAIAEALGQC